MLQEVGQAVLLGLNLLNGTYIGGQVEFCTALGQFVVADVVSETVVKTADFYGIRIGDFGHLGNGCFHLLTGGLLGLSLGNQDGQSGEG